MDMFLLRLNLMFFQTKKDDQITSVIFRVHFFLRTIVTVIKKPLLYFLKALLPFILLLNIESSSELKITFKSFPSKLTSRIMQHLIYTEHCIP